MVWEYLLVLLLIIMGQFIQVVHRINVGTIIASPNGGIVPLVDGQDSQFYNYSLPYAFVRVPEIAIGKLTNII